MTLPTVTAVVLAYLDEPWLEKCVYALLGSSGVSVEVVLVDNGCTDGGVDRLRDVEGVIHIGDGTNLGFSEGCNRGAAASSNEYLALVNGDLIVEPDALAKLVACATQPDIGIAGGSIRLGDDPELLNTAGNEIHFLGFSWVGGFGERASEHAIDRDIAGAMGALAVMRRSVWDDLGGFDASYFAFHEDAELSWRCWQTGRRVHYVPDAIGVHRYEFDRVPNKFYLVERNRLMFVLTCWETRTLLVLAPVFIAMELAMVGASVAGGWWKELFAGWRWLWRNRDWVRKRRAHIQGERTVSDRALAHLMADHLDAKNHPMPAALRPLDELLAVFWKLAQRLLPRRLATSGLARPAAATNRSTEGADYADRLVTLQGARWKQVIDVQAPYRWNLRRLRLGRTLDVGCGIGRNLHNLGGAGVGVDHNGESVAVARRRGFEAYTTAEFSTSAAAEDGSFDALLVAHVLEHMTRAEAIDLVRGYLRYVRPGGTVVMITPQERGFRTDPTHVELLDFDALDAIAAELDLAVTRRYSFPFPRDVGRVFPYNEFVVVAAVG